MVSIETRKIEDRRAFAQPHDAGDVRSRSSPAARSVRSVPATLLEPRTTISLPIEPSARVPQPAARLQRDRGRTRALPLVGVKGFALLRCAAACGDTHDPGWFSF